MPPLPDRFFLSDFPEALEATFEGTLAIEDDWERQGLSEAEKRNSRNLGMRAMVAATLRKGENKPLWSMVAISSRPRRWTSAEIALVEEVAERTWAAVESAKAEQRLRESEAKYRSLFESIDEGYLLSEVIFDENDEPIDILYLEANPAAIRLAGRDFSGQRMREIDPDYEEYWYEIYGQVALTGESVRAERYAQPHGQWFDFYAFKVGGQESRRVASVFQDITDRKRRELNTAFLDEIGKELSVLSAPDEIIQTVGARLGEFLQASGCIFADVDEAKNEATIHHGWNTADVPSLKQTFRLADYFGEEFLRAGRAGKTVIVCDTARDERADAEAYARLKLGAFVTVPFQWQGRWTANITVTTREPRNWRVDEIELLQEIINRVFPRIERARAEEALRESEANYRSLFNTMDQGFCIIEKVETATGQPSDFRYITVNPAFERHTGLSNVVGRTMREFLPNSEQQIVDIYDAVVRTREPQQFEEYVAELDLWFETEVFPAQLSGQIAVLFSNVSDRKQAEAQLRRAAEMDAFRVKLSDALRALSDPLQIQAQACRVLGEQLGIDRAYYVEVHEAEGYARVNQHYSRGDSPSIVGDYPLAEYGWSMQIMRRGETIVVADTQSSNIVPDAERAAMAMLQMVGFVALPPIKGEVLVGALTLNEPAPREWTEAEVELVRETAERIWADIQRAYAETALHESELQRVREQSEREQERQRAETLAELDRAKTLFFSNVSHEFRTPLTLILNPLEEALARLNSENSPGLDGDGSAARSSDLCRYLQESLQVSHRNSLRLLKLVNTLLDFSRIEADRLQANYEPTDLASYTAELASVFRSAIENAGLQLIVNCPPLPEPIYVDRGMWEKIVINLLSNAFKFTFSGTITVTLDRKTDAVQLKVSDTGTGIPTSELPRLFDRFYQVKGARGRSYEGSGIGLSLVQELVKLHGGSIAVTSTVGEGTSFTVTIPTGTAHLAGDRIAVASGKPSATVTTDAFVEEAMRWLPEEGWHDTDFDTDARMNYRGVLHESDLDGTRNQEENQILPLSPSQGGHGGHRPYSSDSAGG